MGQTLHPDEHAARAAVWVPGVHLWRKASPAAKIEVAHAEVRPGRQSEGLL